MNEVSVSKRLLNLRIAQIRNRISNAHDRPSVFIFVVGDRDVDNRTRGPCGRLQSTATLSSDFIVFRVVRPCRVLGGWQQPGVTCPL